jgi:CHASE3 domain sensor protein
MIDSNIDKADGELRAMLAAMVNDPVIDAIRKNRDDLVTEMSDSLRTESGLILKQVRAIATTVSELPDDLKGLRSKMDQVLTGNESLKATGTDAKAELERSVTEIVSRLDLNAQTVEALPARVRHVIADDFAEARRRLDGAVATLRSVTEGAERASTAALQEIAALLSRAEKDRSESKATWLKAARGLRLQVALWGTVSVLEAIGIAALLFRSFGH